jgi:hypothetical protein
MENLHPANVELLRIERAEPEEDESDEEYEARLSVCLPNFPTEVARDWLVRHGPNAFRFYGWLNYRHFSFTLARLPLEFFDSVSSINDAAVKGWSEMILTEAHFRSYNLGKFMIENGTWPVPPIVLDNENGLVSPSGPPVARYQLLEGHHRLAYVRGLQNDSAVSILPEHSCWLVTHAER